MLPLHFNYSNGWFRGKRRSGGGRRAGNERCEGEKGERWINGHARERARAREDGMRHEGRPFSLYRKEMAERQIVFAKLHFVPLYAPRSSSETATLNPNCRYVS